MSERRIPYPISPNHNILLKNRKKIYIEEGVKPKPSKIKKRQNKKKKKGPIREGAAQPHLDSPFERVL